MLRHRLIPLGVASLLFSLTILFMGPITQKLVNTYIKPGVIETVAESPVPDLFQGTILQSIVIKSSDVLPIYGSSEFSYGGAFNPTKFYAGKPTGWLPYLVGHAGSEDLIQALYAGGEDLKGKKIALSLSAQWFGGNGISQAAFGANFSALQIYKMLFNPAITSQTKTDMAERLLQFDEIKKSYPILEGYLKNYNQPGFLPYVLETGYWMEAKVELAALEIQDAVKTIKDVKKLSAKEIAKNAAAKPSNKFPNWSALEKKAIADGKVSESNNPFGVTNTYFDKNKDNLVKLKNSQSKAHFYPSQEYNDLELLMKVLKDEGADPIFIIQPVNGYWYDYTGFPKEQRQKYYAQVRQMAKQYNFALADFSGDEYDMYFMSDPSHPNELGWLKIDKALDNFVHKAN
ncbi:D-alanyl-lipoteichoic acid biosynthesis protein DltD [Desulfitobacterium sp. Sab5]|uniref:D-alanyl-lipoteichoic acid biosynthesis protein DltD n=1 Tax=Desulfitobacterium nosdiversum TaxID=3375356 RepID=UPI003CFABE7B